MLGTSVPDSAVSFPSKVCFVRFAEVASCQTALHLTNCVLVDRALIVVKSKYPEIPDETVALSLAAPAIAVANIGVQQPITHTAPLLPTPPSLFNMAGLGTSVLGNPPSTVAATVAALSAAIPGLAGLAPGMLQLPAMSVASVATSTAIMKPLISVMGTVVPQPPPLTGNVDPTKIEEIRRTVYVGNLSTKVCVSCRMVRMIAVCVCTFFCISILTCKAQGNRCLSLVLCVCVCLSPYLLSSLSCGCLFSFIYLFLSPSYSYLSSFFTLTLSLSPCGCGCLFSFIYLFLSPSYSYLSSFFTLTLSLSPCGCGCCFFLSGIIS
jgi:hypothetical protein